MSEVPELLTIDEAARVMGVSRNTAYKRARQFRATNGTEGLEVVDAAGQMRVPRRRLSCHGATRQACSGPAPNPPPRRRTSTTPEPTPQRPSPSTATATAPAAPGPAPTAPCSDPTPATAPNSRSAGAGMTPPSKRSAESHAPSKPTATAEDSRAPAPRQDRTTHQGLVRHRRTSPNAVAARHCSPRP